MVQNKGLIFKSVPRGWPIEGVNLTIEDRTFDPSQTPPPNGITTKNYSASFDPYQRGRMRSAEMESYNQPFELGKPITTLAVAKVLKSDNKKFHEGDLIVGTLPTEEYSNISEGVANNSIRVLDNPYNLDPKLYVGALGMPGLTAYASFYEIGKPKKGETIFVSAASGAVGQNVGQLAKREGLRVIGSVGSDEKLGFIKKELGFDEGFNYKKEKPLAALKRLAPKGIDIYYENVGGEHLDAALASMTNFGRIICCGSVSQYNISSHSEAYSLKNISLVVPKRIKMQGFIVSDPGMGPQYTKAHQENVAKWISNGTFTAKQSVTYGIDNAIKGFLGMLRGENFGKAVLEIAKLEVLKKPKL